MHRYESSGVQFHYNGDYSGDVVMTVPASAVAEPVSAPGCGEPTVEVSIPFEALRMLVAEYVRSRQISRLEIATASEILDWDW